VGIVDGQAHHADPARLELGETIDVAGQMPVRAGWGEGAGDAEQHSIAAGEYGACPCRLDVAVDSLDGYVRDGVAGLDAHSGLAGGEEAPHANACREALP